MKPAILAGLFFGAFLAAVGLVSHWGAAGAGAPPSSITSGDTNGDQLVDVSDAIFLLLYLFGGGPPPAACADSPGLLATVEDLGARVDALARENDALTQRVAALEATASKTVAVATNLQMEFDGSCEWIGCGMIVQGDGRFVEWEQTTLSGCVLDAGQLVVEIERDGPIEIQFAYPPKTAAGLDISSSRFHLLWDGLAPWVKLAMVNSSMYAGNRLGRMILPDVTAGTHRLSLFGHARCGCDGKPAHDMLRLENLTIRHLD